MYNHSEKRLAFITLTQINYDHYNVEETRDINLNINYIVSYTEQKVQGVNDEFDYVTVVTLADSELRSIFVSQTTFEIDKLLSKIY